MAKAPPRRPIYVLDGGKAVGGPFFTDAEVSRLLDHYARTDPDRLQRVRVTLDGVPVNDDHLQQAQSTQRRKKRSQRKPGKHVVIPGDGDPCPSCDQPMQIREHDGIGAKQLR